MLRPLLLLVVLVAVPAHVRGHGRLTRPRPRENENCEFDLPSDNPCVEDPDGPINLNNWPVNDPANHPEQQSLVCRVPNGKSTVGVIDVDVTVPLDLTWTFTAAHPGDGGLYLSYSDVTGDTQNMQFFKIANFPQQRLNNGEIVQVSLPSWLPPGRAVLRWDWYATHNPPVVEFYTNCVDVNIVSSSTADPVTIPSYKIESGTGNPNAYSSSTDTSAFCFDCDAADWRSFYTSKGGQDGPQCVTGVDGNCCDIVNDYVPSAVSFDSFNGDGFTVCSSTGSSGPPDWLGPQPSPDPGAGRVVISEVMYNPCPSTENNGMGQGSDNDFEFFEIHNPGNRAVSLAGAVVSQSVGFTFPVGSSLAAGEYAIVTIKAESYTQGAYAAPEGTQVWQWSSGRLANSGGAISITSGGTPLDQVYYGIGTPWGAGGGGFAGDHDGRCRSLELDSVTSENGEPDNAGGHWSASCNLHGTPGRANDVFPCGDTADGDQSDVETGGGSGKSTMTYLISGLVGAGGLLVVGAALVVLTKRRRANTRAAVPTRKPIV